VSLTSVLWVSGAPGVGKSTAGWALYQRLVARGCRAAYVDIDQLGMVAPPPSSDPDCHRLKLRNVLEVLKNFRAHGAQQVIVSGVVDPARGVEQGFPASAGLALTLVRLSCTTDELTRRYLGRGYMPERLAALMDIAAALDRTQIGIPVDTTAMSPSEVVDALEALITPGVAGGQPSPPASVTDPCSGPHPKTILLVGPTAVGKSTIGWHVFQASAQSGTTTAFIDIDQLGFVHPGPTAAVKVANLASISGGFHTIGTCRLITVARATGHRAAGYRRALNDDAVTVVHLDAAPRDISQRIAHRANGEGPRLAGNSLIGASPARQQQLATRATEEAEHARQERPPRAITIDTTGRTASEVAADLLGLLGEAPD
jgi:adenylylsulfate kinase-like enzyme